MGVLIVSLLVGMLAVARLTRLLVDDEITIGIRRWVVKRFGEESKTAYFAHCPWCTSIWISLLVMPLAVLAMTGWTLEGIVLAILAIPAASMVAGLLNKWGS
jgi:hypothetical protein